MRVQFDGVTYCPGEDRDRLTGQLDRVRALMRDQRWRTLAEIAEAVAGSEAGVSARLRDLRKTKWGGHDVARRRVPGTALHEYRVTPSSRRQGELFAPPPATTRGGEGSGEGAST